MCVIRKSSHILLDNIGESLRCSLWFGDKEEEIGLCFRFKGTNKNLNIFASALIPNNL